MEIAPIAVIVVARAFLRQPQALVNKPGQLVMLFRSHAACAQAATAALTAAKSRRGRDASYLAPPAQIRTCSFPAYGSHLGYPRQLCAAVCEPASVTRLCGAESGACAACPHSPWSPPFAPPTPPRLDPTRVAPHQFSPPYSSPYLLLR